MNRTISLRTAVVTVIMISVAVIGFSNNALAQSKRNSGKNSAVAQLIEQQQMQIDSITAVADNLRVSLSKSDSLFRSEQGVSAGLREQLIQLDDYRQKLEANNDDFKGENLKLNQSNRILIIFNSLVAILLVVTLVFFLKRINRKKTADKAEKNIPENGDNESPVSTRFASFEDRLMQLERLGKLREKGLLSEDEFVIEKQKILGK